MDQELLSRRKVTEITSLSGPTLWRRCKDGSFPAPVKIGPNRIAWRAVDVKAWLAALRHVDGSECDKSVEGPF
jgi:prophage regulatory protein